MDLEKECQAKLEEELSIEGVQEEERDLRFKKIIRPFFVIWHV
ncbi:hypothetical protein DSCOOX_36600 [Desulfosarcina ovata subsp. ovata]|uniref:Uncharacterized protein n=1 Tax=Desulfosarcina ovata subsp. ovata TaxID=2752305 RepID=A0A5K8AEX0_9BACT|nr:hypothetical protein DSCOOX_36600 [Desulfosarcina ovata subsp. ovata]